MTKYTFTFLYLLSFIFAYGQDKKIDEFGKSDKFQRNSDKLIKREFVTAAKHKLSKVEIITVTDLVTNVSTKGARFVIGSTGFTPTRTSTIWGAQGVDALIASLKYMIDIYPTDAPKSDTYAEITYESSEGLEIGIFSRSGKWVAYAKTKNDSEDWLTKWLYKEDLEALLELAQKAREKM